MSNLKLLKNTNKVTFDDSDRKIARHRFRIFYRTAAAIAVLIAVVTVINLTYQGKKYDSYDILS